MKSASVFRWRDVPRAIWYFLGEDRKKFAIAFVVLFFIFFYELVPAYVAGKIVDFFTHYRAGDSLKTFYYYTFFLGITIPLAGFIRLESRKILTVAGYRMRARARVQGFEKLSEFSMQWHAQENSGSRLQRIFTGSLALREWSRLIGADLLSIGAYAIGILIAFLSSNLWLGIFIACYALAFIIVEVVYNRKMVRLSNEFNRLDQVAGGVYVEGAGNMLALKALGSTGAMTGKIHATEKNAQDIGIIKSKTGFTKWEVFRIIDGPAIVIFFLLIGHGVLQGTFSPGMILVLFSYFVKLAYDVRGKMSDLDEVIIDLKSGLGNMMPIFWEETHAPTGKEPFPANWNEIRIQSAAFAYPSGQVGMQDFDFVLRRNEKLGVAGTSGSGKSTLVKILLGLYRIQKGEFCVDDTNFYDISHDELMKHVSVVLQESELFNMSLRENITMMRELDQALLDRAVDIAQLREVVDRLPDGLDALIGEKGYMLSGGERQRLGIARAIYKNAPIMLFDEATSALDSETERQIMEGLLAMDKTPLRQGSAGHGKTILFIAHRVSTLDYMDRRITIEEGRVIK